MRETEIHLGEPPVVALIGVGVHGVAGRTDVFRLPELWQLHLYQYEAELTVDGTVHTIRPGRVSLVPPGTTVRYRYRGRSEHLFAHLRIAPAGPPRTVPVVQDAGPELPTLTDLLLQAVAAAPSEPDRTRAEIWTTLWRVAHLTPPAAVSPVRTRRSPPPSPTSRPTWPPRSPSPRWPAWWRLPQPSDPAVPRGDGRHGRRLHSPPQTRTRPPSAARHDPLYSRRGRLRRHPRPPGLQQGLPPGTGRLTARPARGHLLGGGR